MTATYDQIGLNYNRTRSADPYLLSRMAHHLSPCNGMRYIDIGCGTGNYTIPMSAQGGSWTGVDPSLKMLNEAHSKPSDVEWLQGTAEQLPVQPGSFDGALASLTLHHWQSIPAGFEQLANALNPGSKVVIFSTTPEQTGGYWLRHYFPKMIEDSMAVLPTLETVVSSMEASGIQLELTENYAVRPDLQDQFLYIGKHRPERYLDPQIREGISSFAMLAHQQEVARGLKQLEADIAIGHIQQIIDQHTNQTGDYLFIVGTRT